MILKDINQIRSFIAIYQTRSLTLAAKKMGMSKAAMAKRLSVLEAEMGYSLFRRSTRKIVPTPEADRIFVEAQRLIDHVHEFEAAFGKDEAMKGLIRVTCSITMAQDFFAKVLNNFQAKYPEVIIELVATDSMLDMVENNIDLAIRVNPAVNSVQQGRKIGLHRVVMVASPEYLKKNKKIKVLDDLKNQRVLFTNSHGDYHFKNNKIKIKTFTRPRDFLTTDPGVLTRVALDGMSISVRPWWNVKDYIDKNQLELVLKNEMILPQGDVWLLSSVGKMQTHRVRILFDELVEVLKPYFE
ncbi:MAG: LysR family transcriptional regulator [Rhizobacter sp.]|nr:LysR family transcriptional regulator [Bacteriovorax sp.]